MATSHVQSGWNQIASVVKGNAAATHTIPGIEIGDKVTAVSRIRAAFGTGGGWGTMATLTASQFSVSAANRIYKKGTPSTFTGMILIVNWVDKNGSTLA